MGAAHRYSPAGYEGKAISHDMAFLFSPYHFSPERAQYHTDGRSPSLHIPTNKQALKGRNTSTSYIPLPIILRVENGHQPYFFNM
jgi:hypothetical protein